MLAVAVDTDLGHSIGSFGLNHNAAQCECEADDTDAHARHGGKAALGIHGAAKQGGQDGADADGRLAIAHRLAISLLAKDVHQQGEATGPCDGGGKPLEEAGNDEERDVAAKGDEDGGAQEASEAEEKDGLAAGHPVTDPAKDHLVILSGGFAMC